MSGVQVQCGWISFSDSHKAKLRHHLAWIPSGAPVPPLSSPGAGRIQFLDVVGVRSPFPCWLWAMGHCSEPLEAACIPQHVAAPRLQSWRWCTEYLSCFWSLGLPCDHGVIQSANPDNLPIIPSTDLEAQSPPQKSLCHKNNISSYSQALFHCFWFF